MSHFLKQCRPRLRQTLHGSNLNRVLRQTGFLSMRGVVLALVALALTQTAQAGSKRMVGFEIRAAFEGITLDGIYSDGLFFSETYFEDGTIRYRDIEGADSGHWTVEDDRFCTFYDNLIGACFFVYRDGPNCYSFYEEVMEGANAGQPSTEWTSRGWNREEDSTCPTAPAAEI